MADVFYKTHNAGFTQFPFPKDLFLQFVRENDGYFPVRIEVPETTDETARQRLRRRFSTQTLL
jgi:hypothetical protein